MPCIRSFWLVWGGLEARLARTAFQESGKDLGMMIGPGCLSMGLLYVHICIRIDDDAWDLKRSGFFLMMNTYIPSLHARLDRN